MHQDPADRVCICELGCSDRSFKNFDQYLCHALLDHVRQDRECAALLGTNAYFVNWWFDNRFRRAVDKRKEWLGEMRNTMFMLGVFSHGHMMHSFLPLGSSAIVEHLSDDLEKERGPPTRDMDLDTFKLPVPYSGHTYRAQETENQFKLIFQREGPQGALGLLSIERPDKSKGPLSKYIRQALQCG